MVMGSSARASDREKGSYAIICVGMQFLEAGHVGMGWRMQRRDSDGC